MGIGHSQLVHRSVAHDLKYGLSKLSKLLHEIKFLCVTNTLAYSVGTLIEMDKSCKAFF
jgi:hypothetical protein